MGLKSPTGQSFTVYVKSGKDVAQSTTFESQGYKPLDTVVLNTGDDASEDKSSSMLTTLTSGVIRPAAAACSAWTVTCNNDETFTEASCESQATFNAVYGNGFNGWTTEACKDRNGAKSSSGGSSGGNTSTGGVRQPSANDDGGDLKLLAQCRENAQILSCSSNPCGAGATCADTTPNSVVGCRVPGQPEKCIYIGDRACVESSTLNGCAGGLVSQSEWILSRGGSVTGPVPTNATTTPSPVAQETKYVIRRSATVPVVESCHVATAEEAANSSIPWYFSLELCNANIKQPTVSSGQSTGGGSGVTAVVVLKYRQAFANGTVGNSCIGLTADAIDPSLGFSEAQVARGRVSGDQPYYSAADSKYYYSASSSCPQPVRESVDVAVQKAGDQLNACVGSAWPQDSYFPGTLVNTRKCSGTNGETLTECNPGYQTYPSSNALGKLECMNSEYVQAGNVCRDMSTISDSFDQQGGLPTSKYNSCGVGKYQCTNGNIWVRIGDNWRCQTSLPVGIIPLQRDVVRSASAQQPEIMQTTVLGAANTEFSANESGRYVFFRNGDRIADQDVIVSNGQISLKLFEDTNANGRKDADEVYIQDLSQITLSKEAGIETYELNSGWNLIHLALVDTREQNAVKTAGGLIDYWNKQGADIKHVARFKNGQFEMLTKREGGAEYSNDYSLLPGEGLFVFNSGSWIQTTFSGNKPAESFPVKVSNGWNLVGFTAPNMSYNSESLLNKINDSGFVANGLSQFDNGLYQSVVYEDDILFGNNFNIVEKRGYFLRVDSGGGQTFKP